MKDIYIDIKYLKGIGEARAKLLKKMGINTIYDLLNHIPRDYINRKNKVLISSLKEGEFFSVIAKIVKIEKVFKPKTYFNLILSDGIDNLVCTWFIFSKWFEKRFEKGQEVWVSGFVKRYKNKNVFLHPDIDIINGSSEVTSFWRERNILPVYPLTNGLKISFFRNAIVQLFSDYHSFIEETLPIEIENKFGFESRFISFQRIHFPSNGEKLELAKKRLAFEELFFYQLMLAKTKNIFNKTKRGVLLKGKKTFTSNLKKRLSFDLTNSQKKVIREIFKDMKSGYQMNRLLQGDVGSGKTIVTLFAMLLAVENGYQAVLVAPTEILAEQHYKSFCIYLEEEDVRVSILKGGNYRGKKELKEKIKNGEIDIIIGTHALFQNDVFFKKLVFVAIDEQHRFGVEQRSILIQNNNFPHILYMSATPIPRSLALTVFGNLDVSIIDELPPTRKNVATFLVNKSEINNVYKEIREQLKKGKQIYFVCPLVEESEKINLLDAESLYNRLKNEIFPDFPVALLHGKMKSNEKDIIMREFKAKKHLILVSTTVIEVGIDVSNASIMVIEHAERFGLSQLHQLRGRVGRGADKSYCYLVAYSPLSKEAKERLYKMVETNNGFLIAEKDLEIRGPGDFFGTMQSGIFKFKFANLFRDQYLLNQARKIAFEIVENDNRLSNYPRIEKEYFLHYKEKEKYYNF